MRFPDYPLVLGHRGSPRELPENTIASFKRAVQEGADGVELDVQPAGDGTAVVIHDATLDRTTTGTGLLRSLDWERIRALRAGDEPMARIEDAADWAVESGAWLNVEVKSAGAESAALAAIRAAGLLDRTLFSSFEIGVVRTLREAAPDADVFLLTDRWNDEVRALTVELGVGGVCLHDPLATPEALGWLSARGLRCVVWTVDDEARMELLMRAGVAAIISNLPAVAAAVRRRMETRGR